MSEGKNPFTAANSATTDSQSDNAKTAWIVAGCLAVLLIAVALLWATALGRVRGLEPLHSKLEEANASLSNALAQIEQSKGQFAALQKEKQTAGQQAKSLEDELRSDLESKDVTIANLQGKLTVTIVDRVLFDSGEAVVQPDGEAVLRKIAGALAAHPELKIHVIGHTDNIPIHTTRFASNWELSTARALAAVHFLTEKAGFDPRRIGAVGYGEFRPVADNATAEGRAANRRIAITILPDELAGADTVPTVKTNAIIDPPLQPLPAGGAETPMLH
jgi:flagellar motor protein MotB